jgi:hypothetical protein
MSSGSTWSWVVGRAGQLLLLLGAIGAGTASPASAQRFLPDDPVWEDPDRLDMPFPEPAPSARGIGPLEFVWRSFVVPGDYAVPAENVNTVGGVPNSSWYTNRHYRSSLSTAALRQGPNREPSPSLQAPWRVIGVSETEEVPRGLIQDGTGRRFRILFDAPAHPEMATGAAMIGSRLLHALGYNVPQHWLRRVRGEQLAPQPDSGVTRATVDSLLDAAAQRPDGSYRALMTRIPDVERRIGPFRFRGTRSDDANDVFPHENRRELRGLRIVAAWIQHSKLRPRHTLDVGVRAGGHQFVRHYLTNLHLTLGSGGEASKPPWSGHEYVLELDRVFERVGTLGLSGGEWAATGSSNAPPIGRFEAEGFEPRAWRPEWPNPAFQRAGPADAFWAAKKVRHFSREDLEAIVSTADYTSDEVADHVLRVLLARRDTIARAYLDWGGGLDRFRTRSGRLTFTDLRAAYGLVSDTLRRTVTWRRYSNPEGAPGPVLARASSSRESIPIPNHSAPYLRATLAVPPAGTTHVFVRRTTQGAASPGGATRRQVVGVERTSPSSSRDP